MQKNGSLGPLTPTIKMKHHLQPGGKRHYEYQQGINKEENTLPNEIPMKVALWLTIKRPSVVAAWQCYKTAEINDNECEKRF